MSTVKKYLESIRQYTSPATRALQQELKAVRETHDSVSAELDKVRNELQRSHEEHASVSAELDKVRNELQRSHEEHASVSAELDKVRNELQRSHEEHASVSAELDKVRNELQRSHEADAQLHADLRQQLKEIESERAQAHQQIELLQRAVAHAEQRQKFSEAHVDTLETKLEEERQRHEQNMQATETRQAHLQAEQQSQLTRQTELANTFHRVSTRLFESLQERNGKQQYSLLQFIIIAVLLFAAGTLIGVFAMQGQQDSSQELAAVARDLGDMRGFMKQHIDNQDALLKDLTQAVNNQLPPEAVQLVELPPPEVAEQTAELPPQETASFTPDIRELQTSLMALGFDLGMTKPNGELGVKTRQALQEFRQFYVPQSEAQQGLISESLVLQILQSADLVRVDAERFRIDREVLAAIRLGSIRTGVDFSFLMEVARVESNFDATVRAPGSSATGLFQFRDGPWLEAIQTFGADYGLQDYASRVELIEDKNHEQQPIVHDPLQQEVLALRLNPRLSTLMAAENIKRNLQYLSERIGREPRRTDLYLAHYFGPSDAVLFLKTLDESPTTLAAVLFPEAADRNPRVFRNRQQPRSVEELYQWFDSRFNTTRYDVYNPA
jgi:predicted  nucleic acid-binding Zn-ribbon protein/peptidoglycan hydrolase-like protein with peptidoglycan-binding domain